ncbi:MAG: MFS transporter [Chloroflexi bacterium RBG_19FT_COMBO_49_13]|nr:MAG: MFS transporter [Chloroflexi bacterium RBG_19FT_COMBO_49_13]
MIEVEGLTKDYGARRAIDNLTFNANQGEVLGFLGPNGAGKTTTMRILTGFMPPTAGEARVAGFDVVEQSLEVRKRIGYLPETVPLYSDMTVYDYLKFMADLRRLENAEERIDDVLEIVHMTDRAEGYIGNLSKGMRQRIGLAQALLHHPDVLILDEPTIGLDPAQIIEVRSLIKEIGRERTVLLSTHILSEAQQLCDRVLIINKGKIVAEDTPERLQARLTGAQRVILRIAGDPDGLAGMLTEIPGVLRAAEQIDGSLEFESSPGEDVRPAVARTVIGAGYDLLEMRPVGLSLEDIFMQLTREEPEPPEVSDAGLEVADDTTTDEKIPESD